MSISAIPPPEPLHIAEWVVTSGPLQVPPQSYLALLLALDDAGTCHNQEGLTYACPAGTLLLLGPADRWQLNSQQPARLAWLCFSLDYLASQIAGHSQAADWQLLQAHGAALGSAGHLAASKVPPALVALLTLLVDCYAGRRGVAQDALANPLAGTVLRALGPLLAPVHSEPTATHAASVVRQVLAYIRRHAAVPDRLHLGHLAQEFAYSPSHLSALFRQHMREPLHQYIVRHRLQLVENQLQASVLTVSQIADELGFVDVCHLNKQFKKRYHLTPTEYRRQRRRPSSLSYA
ncbi:AraC family transcriptional regulator [Hymenobacter setariae]|uniref:AraC family transcriptional regulator n=1 Tax=Hymenobacter setariae TaxID=2594794 RepID=UPI001F43F41C|nr:AraC family transcriptional regulator [Hymenobacter setariae]